MLTCLLNPGVCIQNAIIGIILGIPWWVYVLVAIIALGAAWKLAGIPGLVAAAAGMGFLLGKFRLPSQKAQQQAEFDRQNDNSADFPTQQQIDHKPKVPSKPVSDFWKKYHQ